MVNVPIIDILEQIGYFYVGLVQEKTVSLSPQSPVLAVGRFLPHQLNYPRWLKSANKRRHCGLII